MKTLDSILPRRPRPAVAAPVDHELFLSNFGEKDRKGISKHLMVYEQELGAAATQRWHRFAHLLMAMAPYPAKLVARQAIQFYIPDGKYRMQVFALEVLEHGALAVYTDNVLAEAVRCGILSEPVEVDGQAMYRIGQSAESLKIAALDVQTLNPAPVCKGMTGWHRKAICISLPADATTAQVEAAERLCAMAATQWSTAA